MSESDRLISATMMYDVFEHHAISLKRSFVAYFLAGYGIFYVVQLISSPKSFVLQVQTFNHLQIKSTI